MVAQKKRCAYCGRIKAEFVQATDKVFDKDFGAVLKRIVGVESELTPQVLNQISVCHECANIAVALEPIAVKTREMLIKIIKPKPKRKRKNSDDAETTAGDLLGLSAIFGNGDNDNNKNNATAITTTAKTTPETTKTPKKVVQRRKSTSAAKATNKSLELNNPVASGSTLPIKKTPKKSAVAAAAKKPITPAFIINGSKESTTTNDDNEEDDDEDDSNKNVDKNFAIKLPKKTTPKKQERPKSIASEPPTKQNFEEASLLLSTSSSIAALSPLKGVVSNAKNETLEKLSSTKKQATVVATVAASPKPKISDTAAVTASPAIKRQLFTKFADDDEGSLPTLKSPKKSQQTPLPIQSPHNKKRRIESENDSQENHNDDDDGEFKNVCTICCKIYYHEERYAAHVASNKCAQAAHKCQHCGRRFLKLHKMQEHIRRKHADDTNGDDNDDNDDY